VNLFKKEQNMKMLARFLIALAIIGSASLGLAKTQGEYIQEAEKHHQSGYIQEAAKTMQEAVKEYPESSAAHSYLGLYLGMRAGQTNDMTECDELADRGSDWELMRNATRWCLKE
jgi:Tfp pilus assembly protein PilV